MDINRDFKAKSSVKMNLGLGSNQKSNGADQVERLRRELEEAHSLVCSLRAEVDQKEHIATLALTGSKVSSQRSHDMQKLFAIPALPLSVRDTNTAKEFLVCLGFWLSWPLATAFSFCQFWIHFHLLNLWSSWISMSWNLHEQMTLFPWLPALIFIGFLFQYFIFLSGFNCRFWKFVQRFTKRTQQNAPRVSDNGGENKETGVWLARCQGQRGVVRIPTARAGAEGVAREEPGHHQETGGDHHHRAGHRLPVCQQLRSGLRLRLSDFSWWFAGHPERLQGELRVDWADWL